MSGAGCRERTRPVADNKRRSTVPYVLITISNTRQTTLTDIPLRQNLCFQSKTRLLHVEYNMRFTLSLSFFLTLSHTLLSSLHRDDVSGDLRHVLFGHAKISPDIRLLLRNVSFETGFFLLYFLSVFVFKVFILIIFF